MKLYENQWEIITKGWSLDQKTPVEVIITYATHKLVVSFVGHICLTGPQTDEAFRPRKKESNGFLAN